MRYLIVLFIFTYLNSYGQAENEIRTIETYEKHKVKRDFYAYGQVLELKDNNCFEYSYMTHSLRTVEYGVWKKTENILTLKVDSISDGQKSMVDVYEYYIRKDKLYESANGKRIGRWILKKTN
ncbi:hypothetical protein [Aestuariivivens sp. NBU2969]|uniref:hypothetical protein n=1 Tax=Aestuariivivens sp. NBU2969 TaxID=2873267 RepID=UPI001CBCF1B4|nr:hypothetical protein [Aestuariivivens sp. NBU2969]